MPKKISKPRTPKAVAGTRQTAEYRHTEETPARPDVGTQPQFKKCASAERWIQAINAESSFGVRQYVIAKKVSEVPKLIAAAAGV